MIGRRVRTAYGQDGTVERVTDPRDWWHDQQALVRLDQGGAWWIPLTLISPTDGLGPLPIAEHLGRCAEEKSIDAQRSIALRRSWGLA